MIQSDPPLAEQHTPGAAAPVLVWFRDDLRLADNPALTAAVASGRPVIAAYCLDEESPGLRHLGGAARWWLHESLAALGRNLEQCGSRLVLRRGRAHRVIDDIVAETGCGAVYWNRRYDAGGRTVDAGIKASLNDRGVDAQSFNAALLFEPWEVVSKAGTPLRVFTPFWRAACAHGVPATPTAPPEAIAGYTGPIASDRLEDWALKPTKPDWSTGLAEIWEPGEHGARTRLEEFVDSVLPGYAEARDRPGSRTTSMLSPHLRFGEISPRQIWHTAQAAMAGAGQERDLTKFQSELGWREFAYHLLFHCDDLNVHNIQSHFDAFPWREDAGALKAWQAGLTGYPIVDAGMRELWTTGWMHNRVRMVVASFLVKHLLIDWRVGEAWFWDTLVDADPANNPASWQWVAGSGADAAPYFRIFNPVLQGQKFDGDGAYVRKWVPEIAALPDRYIHCPWEAPAAVLGDAGVTLGKTYPEPMVDHGFARRRALDAYGTLRKDAA